MSDGSIGNLWVRIKADISHFKESMQNLGKNVPKSTDTKTFGDETEESFHSAGMEADVFASKLSTLGMQSAGMGKYSRMMGSAFKQVGPQLKALTADLKAAGAGFKTSMTGGQGFVKSLKTLGAGLKAATVSMKAFGMAMLTAMGPLIAIVLIIEAAMWLWNKWNEHQEKVRKQTEATNLAIRTLGISVKDAGDKVKKYGIEWASTAQNMLAFGHSSMSAYKLASQIHDLANKIKDGGLGLGNVKDEADRLTATLAEGIDGLRHYGVYMDETQLEAYALEKGIISVCQSMDYTTTQAAMLAAITEKLTSGKITGIPITDAMKDAAKAAQEARKSIGLMSFDSLNAISKQEDAASKNPLEGIYADLVYDGDALDAIVGKLELASSKTLEWSWKWGYLKSAMDIIKDWDGWGKIADAGKWAWGKIKDAAGSAWGWMTETAAPWLGEKWDHLKTSATNAWNTIKSVGGSILDGIKDTAMNVWTTITETIPMLFRLAIDKILGFFRGLWDDVKKGFSDAVSNMPIIGDIVKGAGNAVNSVKGFFGLASGGVALPGKPGLVTVGDNLKEPEIVAPQSYITQAVADALSMAGGGSAQTIQLTVNLDGAAIAKQIVRPLTQEQRRLGL